MLNDDEINRRADKLTEEIKQLTGQDVVVSFFFAASLCQSEKRKSVSPAIGVFAEISPGVLGLISRPQYEGMTVLEQCLAKLTN